MDHQSLDFKVRQLMLIVQCNKVKYELYFFSLFINADIILGM